MNQNIILGISNISVAALFIVLSIPLIQKKVKMNRTYGVRIKKAFESDENWYKINACGGRCLLVWSVVLTIIGIATFALPLDTGSQPNGPLILVVALAPLIVLIPCVVQILSYAKKL